MKQQRKENRFMVCQRNICKYLLFSVLIGGFFLLIGCAPTIQLYQLDGSIRKVELGMSKKQVSSIVGKSYKIIEAVRSETGTIESWGYIDMQDGMYKLTFVNGCLESLLYERPEKCHVNHKKSHSTETATE